MICRNFLPVKTWLWMKIGSLPINIHSHIASRIQHCQECKGICSHQSVSAWAVREMVPLQSCCPAASYTAPPMVYLVAWLVSAGRRTFIASSGHATPGFKEICRVTCDSTRCEPGFHMPSSGESPYPKIYTSHPESQEKRGGKRVGDM